MGKENTTDATALLAGDRVTWTDTTSNRRSFNFRVREGRVVEQVGNLVTVKYRGKQHILHRDRVRRVGERNELTEFVCGKANTEGQTTRREPRCLSRGVQRWYTQTQTD